MSTPRVVIEVLGEGKTDVGELDRAKRTQPEPPSVGVVPVLLSKLCGSPASLHVIRRRVAFLQQGTLTRKVAFAKTQAFYNRSAGVVFVVDTEGDSPDKKRAELSAGRDFKLPDYPTAIGVAHTCIEVWLLADAGAIARGLKLASLPEVPPDPEALPAPRKDRDHNPKTVLAQCAGTSGTLSSGEATRIAREMNDLRLAETRCPRGFAPFAADVREQLTNLF